MNSLVIPIVMWGDKPPTHKICTVALTQNRSSIITGCMDGQIVIWDTSNEETNIQPKTMLFGHSGAVVSIVPVTTRSPNGKTRYFVSASSNNELCMWDLADGRCLEQTKLAATPTHLIPLEININGKLEPCVICYGLFAEIFIMSATGLNIICTLVSRIYPDWVSSCCVVTSDGETSIIGLTMSGTIKVWQLPPVITTRCPPILEDESKQLRCQNAIELKHLLEPVNLLLVVLPLEWQLYDGGDFSLLCTIEKVCSSPLVGGDFLRNYYKVIIWDQNGTVFVYQLPFTPKNQELYRDNVRIHSNTTPKLLYSFSDKEPHGLSFPPAMSIFHNDSLGPEAVLVSGDSSGRVSLWTVKASTKPMCDSPVTLHASNSLRQFWKHLGHQPAGVIDRVTRGNSHSCVTTSLYLENLGQLACGREDGSIILVPAAKTCKSHLLRDERVLKKGGIPHRTLRGHGDRITCLLYPHQESNRYSAQIFVSGAADFSVILWEIFTGVQVHTFSIHGGDITQLLVPPEDCSPRVQQSICSIASDNSVAILSIKERKCVMLASRHTSSVSSIKWRPADDFMMVSCSDGALFVWQMETGHLDRYVTGLTAIQILEACNECQSNRTDNVVHGTVNLSQAFKRRSLAGFKAAAQQGIKSILETIEDKLQDDEVEQSHAAAMACSNALLVQPLRACPSQDYDSHVLFFNTETIIGTLLQEKALQKKMTQSQKRVENGESMNPAKKVFNAFIYQVKNQFLDNSDQASSALSSPAMQRKSNEKEKRHKKHKSMEIDSVMNIAQLLLSCLHGWGLDEKLDNICKSQLGLCEPIVPVCFGLLSREGQTALMLPNWPQCYESKIQAENTSKNGCSHFMYSIEHAMLDQGSNKLAVSHTGHWEISNSVTTQHLIGVISVANTLMELSSSGFSRPKASVAPSTNGFENDESTSSTMSETFTSNSSEVARVKQGWSLLATMHCVLLSELLNSPIYKPPKIELLARRWQDRCLEVREAAQALLLAKLRQLEPEGRRRIVNDWAQHMPDYIQQQHIDLIPNTRNEEAANVAANAIRSHPSTPVDDVGDKASIASTELATEAPPQRPGAQKTSYESRRRQATAVIILGVIGAEFGQEMEPSRSNSSSPAKSGQSGSEILDGFGLSNYSLARNTCKALVYLLLQPASSRLPAHAPIRRAAIDLLGRGFTVWEPYIEVSAVLLGLMELCIDYNTHIASIQSGLPLSAKADSCRSSHHALCLIASARPLTFITTIAREVARHNAAAANPQHQALLATSIIVRSKAEILRIIELLAEKMMHDVMDLLVEVMDIILFCIDTTSLRTSHSLVELVPALSRFHTISCDPRTRRIAVGTRRGAIYLYDLRTNKHQEISRGRCAVTTLAFSPEGKYLSVYSLQDNHLSFWMTSSSLFGMLQSQVKCVKTVRPLPPAVSQRLAISPDHSREFSKVSLKLKWINNRITILLLPDGTEYRCHV